MKLSRRTFNLDRLLFLASCYFVASAVGFWLGLVFFVFIGGKS